MSNKFVVSKYAAIASAVALACAAGVGGAATIGAPTSVSKSGSAANGAAAATEDLVFASAPSVILAASYAPNDTVVVSISGGQFRTSTTGTASMTCLANTTTSTLLMGFVSKTSSAVTFRVTGGTGLENTGFSCSIPVASLSVVRNSVVSTGTSGVKLSSASYIGGGTQSFDTTTAGTQFLLSVAQFSAVVSTAFSGTVDVASSRLAWSGTTTPSTSKSMTLLLSGLGEGLAGTEGNLADLSTVTATAAVYGANQATPMFAFLDDDGNGCTAADITDGAGSASVTSGGSLSISSNCATLTWSFPAAVGYQTTTSRSVSLTLSKASSSTGLAIQQGSFSVAPTFTVSNAATATQAIGALAAGSFDINGAVVNIPYMPYGNSGTSAITQAYYITNTSTTAGTVTGTARNEAGVLCNLGSLGVAAAQSVTNLSSTINAGVASCYGTAGVVKDGTRVYIDLVANAAQGNILVNASYNVGGNSRVQVVNDSNQVRVKNTGSTGATGIP